MAENPERATWFCPACGTPMRDETPKRSRSWFDALRMRTSSVEEARWLTCEGEDCLYHGTTWILHHPTRGLQAGPSDNMSLTWLK